MRRNYDILYCIWLLLAALLSWLCFSLAVAGAGWLLPAATVAGRGCGGQRLVVATAGWLGGGIPLLASYFQYPGSYCS